MHTDGVAVDLTLVAADGAELDLGTPFDEFSQRAHMMNASAPVLARRLQLRDAMVAARFAPYANEWWHFSIPLADRVPVDGTIRP